MYADAVFHEQPDWSRQPGRRLALNFLPSTLIVIAVLMLLRLPVAERSLPLTELVVRILISDAEDVATPPTAEEQPPQPVPVAPSAETGVAEEPVPVDVRPATDWYARIPDAARAVAEERPQEYSINPVMDERRRRAAEQFAPRRAPVARPIWENVERDVMGRTLLRSGDCYRVLDDPNVGSRDAFLTFGQFIASCERHSGSPQMLPWVSEMQDRREGQARYGHPAAE